MPMVLHHDNTTDDYTEEYIEEDDPYTCHGDDESMIDPERTHSPNSTSGELYICIYNTPLILL